jgi:glutathione S-transferase
LSIFFFVFDQSQYPAFDVVDRWVGRVAGRPAAQNDVQQAKEAHDGVEAVFAAYETILRQNRGR